MLTIALRNVRENPSRYVLTGLAIALGVAFYVATTVLTTTVDRSISGSIDGIFDGVDAAVRSNDVIETDFFDIRAPLDSSVVDEIAAVDGVSAIQPVLTGYAQVVGNDGKVVADSTNAFVWSSSEDMNGFELASGRAPQALNEIVLDDDAFAQGGFELGDQVRVLPRSTADMTVVGAMVAPNGAIDGTTSMATTVDTLQQLFETDQVTSVNVASDSLDEATLVSTLQASLVGDIEVVTGQKVADEFKELINQFVSIISIFLTVFAAIALFVAVFVIYNTFTITVAQRIKEMALLRAIGAGRRQVMRNVLLESLAVGVVASIAGLVIGLGLGWVLLRVFDALGFPLGSAGLTVSSSGLVIAFFIGLIVTLVSAIVPARRGASVPPIEALRSTAIEEVGSSRFRINLGLLGVAIGAVLAVIGAAGTATVPAVAGIALLFGGVIMAAPVIIPAMARLAGRPLIKARGIVGELASENASRSPKRTATTALALMVGVMLVVAATVIAASFRESIRGDLDRAIAAELVIEAGDGFLGGVDPALTAQLENVDSVDALSTVRPVQAELDGDPVSIAGVHANQLDQVLNLTTTQGSLAELAGAGIGLSIDEAESRNLGIGDSVVLSTQLTEITLPVVTLYTPDVVVGGLIVDVSVADRVGFQPLDSLVLVSTDDTAISQPGIEALLAGDPTATVKTARAYADDQAGELNTLLNLLYGLLALSVIIALLGVANTMTLSIHERTRELALLRAVGMSGPQLRSAVRSEGALIGLVGSMVGVLLGIFFGWLAHRATVDTFPVFSLPWIQLLVIAIVGILAGLLAGWRPARRASELNILEAISHS